MKRDRSSYIRFVNRRWRKHKGWMRWIDGRRRKHRRREHRWWEHGDRWWKKGAAQSGLAELK